jgi:tripartite-type tricarboxylate transporter receptor subunit TctC
MHFRLVLTGFALAAALLGAPGAHAQAWPQKPIRLIVGFAPGGVADITARVVAQKLSEQLGQQIVVDNRPSAGGIVAADAVAKAAPDGYTLLLLTNGNAVSASLFTTLPYDTIADFAPVSLLGTFDVAVVASAGAKIDSMPALMAYAKANPGKLNIGTINVGSTSTCRPRCSARWRASTRRSCRSRAAPRSSPRCAPTTCRSPSRCSRRSCRRRRAVRCASSR